MSYDSRGDVLLFYKYYELKEPESVQSWIAEQCNRLELSGKVRVAREGINGTIGGHSGGLDEFIRLCDTTRFESEGTCVLSGIDFKRSGYHLSGGCGGHEAFASLSVKLVPEIITLGRDEAVAKEGGVHTPPEEWHRLLQAAERDKETRVVLIDCRNTYEHQIGRFKGDFTVLRPPTRKFSQFPEWVDDHRADLEGKEVLMYCTGGIRCERGSAYLRHAIEGASSVRQLHGGIHRYIEIYPDGYFRGANFVFDGRWHVRANSDVLSSCRECGEGYDVYEECSSPDCKAYLLVCPPCRGSRHGAAYCSDMCEKYGPKWTKRQKCRPIRATNAKGRATRRESTAAERRRAENQRRLTEARGGVGELEGGEEDAQSSLACLFG